MRLIVLTARPHRAPAEVSLGAREAVRDREHYARNRWVLSLLFLGGLRISELIGNTMGGFYSRHDRDGIERWWINVFYATILWSIGYWIVYPSWPLVSSYAKGVIGYSSRADVAQDLLDLKAWAKLRPLYYEILEVAEGHLSAGWDYTCALPRWPARSRIACALPLLIGIRTLGRLRGANPLDPSWRVKASRPEVKKMLRQLVLRYPFRRSWDRLFEEWRPG